MFATSPLAVTKPNAVPSDRIGGLAELADSDPASMFVGALAARGRSCAQRLATERT
jgi:hypothetical protein